MARKIIDSDDDDDKPCVITKVLPVKKLEDLDGDEWLDIRNAKTINEEERKMNIALAKQSRVGFAKQNGENKPKPKKRNDWDDDYELEEEEDDESDESVIVNEGLLSGAFVDLITPMKRFSTDSVVLEDTPGIQEDNKSSRLLQTSKLKSEEMIMKNESIINHSSSNHVISKNKVKYVDSDDDYGTELSPENVLELANNILSKCKSLTQNLQTTLRTWEGQSSDDKRECVELIKIDTKNNQLIQNADLEVICPGLVLKGYQLVGVNWLKLLYQSENVNGILADDMGLGKTIQSIAFLGWLSTQVKKEKRFHLIVVPASTLTNWLNELQKFCPSFNVTVYHGSQEERLEIQYNIKMDMNNGIMPDIILSTYTIFERSASKSDRSFLYSLNFSYLICDEGHCLKNSSSSRFKNLLHIRSDRRLLLSGTPVQNNIEELLAMLSFLNPHLFSSRKCEIVMNAFMMQHGNKNTVSSSTSNGLTISQLRSILAPFVLRRIKQKVLDQLTEKSTYINKLPMTSYQKQVYDNIMITHATRREKIKEKVELEKHTDKILESKFAKKSTVTSGNDVTSIETNTSTVSIANKGIENIIEMKAEISNIDTLIRSLSSSEMRHLFTALRKAANHPLLLRVRYTDTQILDYIAQVTYACDHFGNSQTCRYDLVRKEIDAMSDFDLHHICLQYPGSLGKYVLQEDVLFDSPKMAFLREHIPKLIAEGHRILIFSQWTRILDLLTVLCEAIDTKYLRLDGSTPVMERQYLIDTFNKDLTYPLFLLSTKAGGLGINLCAADTVILHDLDFNPENDRQAEDRCHRIGQTKPVTVYKLICEASVDEMIFEMGERKRELSDSLLSNDSESLTDSTKKRKLNNDDDEDIDAIGFFLTRALSKLRETAIPN